ncbi:MFS transporter, YNFM family, putative membrane transport protein [Desulfuromusa kysingii]|uniref:MFS transporter, YNFM family, putative membrane transport protein n=1 Tax=Desulfuromusa kysingii TaxID=37625 RepID=A0A1H3VS25_9BACT|nr:MFS transporter [Desulfuromusa kysingii]SDZ77577.1 MFS transporter, YNFM family, putative membrane transport protein [Desulfuromusa kysingii]
MPLRKYSEILPIIFNTILVLSVLYAPQPLLPVLSLEFGISREAAAALTTVTFIPLALAPLVYGYILETVSPIRVLKIAVPLLVITELFFAGTSSFSILIIIRVVQGLLVPAILTSLMTYLSGRSSADTIQRVMALYVAATIFGGFIGRATSGLIANLFGWRFSFLALAITLCFGFLTLFKLPEIAGLRPSRPKPKALLEILKKPAFLSVYLGVFCLFLIFAAVMNFLPFRLTELSDQANELKIGLMYSGYMMGIVTSLGAPKFVAWIKSETATLRVGFICLFLTLLGLATNSVWILFGMMFLFCGAMFLVHSTASGLVNQLAGSQFRGMTNGLYVAFYYAGGSIGSFAPGIIYRHYGWNGFLITLALACCVGYICISRIRLPAKTHQ